jgi:anti-sigma B factor antagonist
MEPRDGLLEMELRQTPDGSVVSVRGDIDVATARGFEVEFTRTLPSIRDGRVILDMAGLGSLDDAGIHALTRAAERAERHHVRVVVRNFLVRPIPQKDSQDVDIFELLSTLHVRIPSAITR